MNDDFGLVCQECGTVTIFDGRASHPRRCSRCGAVLASSRRPRVREMTATQSGIIRSYTSPDIEDQRAGAIEALEAPPRRQPAM